MMKISLNALTQYSRAMALLWCLIPAVHILAGEGSPPNIILVLLDDAGYADFGFMGSEDLETPQIDRLAAQGVAFADFHVSATVCAPSRAGLITGRYQQRFGFEANIPPPDKGIDPAETTLAEALRTEGYRTFLVGKWHLGEAPAFHPLNHGFDEFYGFLGGSRSYFPSPILDQPRNPLAILHNRTQVPFEGYLTDVFTDRAIDFIRSSADQPFFLFLSYNAPHTPMEAKEEHLEKYRDHPRRLLAAMTWSVDENIGRLRDTLDELNLTENTLIFFLSDNGGAESNQSSNRPLKGWKGNKYEGGHRVPCILSWPARIDGNRRYDGLSSSLDVFATAVAAARGGEDPDPAVDGVDLIPFLEGRRQGNPHEELFWRKGDMAAMRDNSFKLIRLEDYGYRLYDLSIDPGEQDDLREAGASRFQSMRAAFARWEGALPPPLWYEDEDWSTVTWEIHFDLMNNRPVRFRTPHEMRLAKKGENP